MNNQLQNRVLRHLKPPEMKKLHWHIDFLLQSIHAEIAKIVLFPSNRKEECEIAAQIRAQMIEVVPNFGSSDCKCESHLFFSGKKLPF